MRTVCCWDGAAAACFRLQFRIAGRARGAVRSRLLTLSFLLSNRLTLLAAHVPSHLLNGRVVNHLLEGRVVNKHAQYIVVLRARGHGVVGALRHGARPRAVSAHV